MSRLALVIVIVAASVAVAAGEYQQLAWWCIAKPSLNSLPCMCLTATLCVCGSPSPVLSCAPFATTAAQLYPGCRTDADCQAVGDPGAYCKANHRYSLLSTHHVYSAAQSPRP